MKIQGFYQFTLAYCHDIWYDSGEAKDDIAIVSHAFISDLKKMLVICLDLIQTETERILNIQDEGREYMFHLTLLALIL